MAKLAILHFLPLEYYPPITNFLDYLNSDHHNDFENIKVYSTYNIKGRKEYTVKDFGYNKNETAFRTEETSIGNNLKPKSPKINPIISIKRSPFPKESDNTIIRLFKYLHYNLFTLINLLIHWPNRLLYYESYSAWPAYFYTRFFNRKCEIFIHNHEYADKRWYVTTMKQVRYFHQLERKWLYPRAVWNSQTNEDRLHLFWNDHPELKTDSLKVMPNYPPGKWKESLLSPKIHDKHSINNPLKIVYIGSISFQNTYILKFCNWIEEQDGEIIFDVYSYNLYENVKSFLRSLNSSYINYFEEGIEYSRIPEILNNYNIGIIFYTAYSDNVINCVSNKFYEYFACGLDVWFSDIMRSTHSLVTKNTYPKVVPVDFEKLDEFDWQKAVDKEGCAYKPSEYYCEEVYEELVKKLLKD